MQVQEQELREVCSPALPTHQAKPSPSHQLCSNFPVSASGWVNKPASLVDLS